MVEGLSHYDGHIEKGKSGSPTPQVTCCVVGNSYLIGKARADRDPTTIPQDPVEARLNTTQRMGSDVKKRRRALKPTHNLKADARTRPLLRTHWARLD